MFRFVSRNIPVSCGRTLPAILVALSTITEFSALSTFLGALFGLT